MERDRPRVRQAEGIARGHFSDPYSAPLLIAVARLETVKDSLSEPA